MTSDATKTNESIKTCQGCNREFRSTRDFVENGTGWSICARRSLWFRCPCGASLTLQEGRYPWFSPSLFLRPATAAVFKELASKNELPHLATGVMEIQQALRSPNSDASTISKALRTVPTLAAEVLTKANAARASSLPKIVSVEHATTFVGPRMIAELVQLAAIRSFKLSTHAFDAAAFWTEALATGHLSELLARKLTPHVAADEAYLAGSMMNIGKIVAAIALPERTDALQASVQDLKTLPHWRKAEAAIPGPDHMLLGEIGSVVWGLPEYVREAAVKHHDAPRRRPPGEPRTLVDVVTFANQMAHWVRLEPHRIDETLLNASAKAFQMTGADLEKLATELTAQVKARAAAEAG